jgi:hypothetical protein
MEELQMGRYQLMLVTMVLGAVTSFGHAAASPGDDYAGREVGTVRFIDRQQNLIQLDDGTELRTTDSRMLQNIHEGMRVLVDFVHSADNTNELNSIQPVGADTQGDVTPTTD